MSDPIRAAHTATFYDSPPQARGAASKHWITRGANFVVVATQAEAGAALLRAAAEQSDEYMVLLPEDVSARLEAADQVVSSEGDSLTIVPPGNSRVTVGLAGWVYRVFTARCSDLAAQASNAAEYDGATPGIAPLESWPLPADGYRLRHYRLAEHVRTDTTMRLFRSRELMINVFLPNKAPRDVRKMTPHAHEAFEQGSLAVRGRYVHHIRYPWTPDLTAWRDDEHGEVGAPSLAIIPPKAVHTSQSLGDSGMRLVDIFAPPRDDFSLKPGLVCNSAEYPLPERLRGVTAPAAIA